MKRKKVVASILTGSIMLFGSILPAGQASAAVSASGLISSAKTLMGTPYVFGGTSTSGFDCSGFIDYIFKKQHVSLPRTADGIYQQGKSVSRSSLRPGDLVFFKTSRSSAHISHTGMYIGNGKFIHAATSKGVSISDLNDQYYWGSRYAGAKRI
ncbi:C40 family peptidase [Aneurinibacillus sp. Ricciae_BoGa-3]|uniref:C40 family peptidase n=1 Tax=Aneurinibacillus sp. Ricciae_BoGa-3 TaxID=3022697 RepID=UPI002341791B|nr:C40 family peptidase [Aneurinibacillus sp. Ricciae_BoGa-3]WCK55884.1 C40 family peptidase [Aneurinibacillus sp. Ricciae_BoGa-3]